jgi:hypothetical protein
VIDSKDGKSSGERHGTEEVVKEAAARSARCPLAGASLTPGSEQT